jgi:heme-degrading monooxygenase HmoA
MRSMIEVPPRHCSVAGSADEPCKAYHCIIKMYVILWEFRPAPGREPEFEQAYGPDGRWIQLFRRTPGYLGSELLHDAEDFNRYLTLDRWESPEAYERFRVARGADYEALDRECVGFTEHEARIGAFQI